MSQLELFDTTQPENIDWIMIGGTMMYLIRFEDGKKCWYDYPSIVKDKLKLKRL
jgi:hypothetical protein